MIRELIDTEVEAVVGGTIDITAISQFVKQTNKSDQHAFAFGGDALNVLGSQSNTAVNNVG
jgi:hypothetical protein